MPSTASRPLRPAPRVAAALIVSLALVGGCGKKGPPLAPLDMSPESPGPVVARRLGNTVYLQMTVPAKSAVGQGAFSIDHLEVYAVTLAPGAVVPPNRDLLKAAQMVAQIPVAPPLDPEAAEPDTPETRPRPGDAITFVETLTPEVMTPRVITAPPKVEPAPKKPAAAIVPAPAAAAAPAAGPAVLTRLYVVRGVTARRRPGPPSPRADVPLLEAPGAARLSGTKPTWDAASVTVTWQPPASSSDETSGVLYNIYGVPAAGSAPAAVPVTAPVPLNAKPLEVTTFSQEGVAPGIERCFIVRSVATVGASMIESEPSGPICVTPTDTFPPAAPKNLQAVGSAGVINLIWDANTDADLAGYLVLRGEAPGDTLQPLTPEPIAETRYQDRSITPGVTYTYAIVAVDRATPPNRSAASNRVQETAR
ncbi:MAG: fibronectin type III domain-containing protein [Vicinamibacterales bacterium]